MSSPRNKLEHRLSKMSDIAVRPWKDTELICVFYRGKEFAHFHGDAVLDIRLSPKIIRDERLSREVSERIHPNRSKNSRWICVEVESDADIEKLVQLVGRACEELK